MAKTTSYYTHSDFLSDRLTQNKVDARVARQIKIDDAIFRSTEKERIMKMKMKKRQ